MIEINRKGETVRVEIDTNLRVDKPIIVFERKENYEFIAQLIVDKIEKELRNAIERERREHYERGWADAKAKKAKETVFSRCI